MKSIYLLLYYLILQYLPMQPFPGYKLFYKLRYFFIKRIIKKCGSDCIIKNRCYFGNGDRLTVGDRSQLGQNVKLGGLINIGNDVLMGPDVVMMFG